MTTFITSRGGRDVSLWLAGKFEDASGLRGNVVGPALANCRPKEAAVPERGGAKVAEVDLKPPEAPGFGE